MTTVPNPPTTNGRNDGGPGTRVDGRLSDIARSIPNPAMDVTLPSLLLSAWDELGQDRRRIEVMISWQALQDSQVDEGVGNPRTARQPGPTPQTMARVENVFAGVDRGSRVQQILRDSGALAARMAPLHDNSRARVALKRGVDLYLALSQQFRARAESLNQGIDLRAPWFPVRDQKDVAGCVGFAVGDLLRRQLDMRLDVPSARFIWQAAKEMDGEERPTTMIAGAGTSLRAALYLVRRYGFALEAEVDSNGNDLYSGGIDEFYRTISARRVLEFVNLGSDAKLRLAWLSLGRPIACSLTAGRNFLNASGPDAQIAADEPRAADAFSHAVTIMGYRVGKWRGDTWVPEPRSLEELADVAEREFADRPTDDPTPRNHDEFPVQYLIRNSSGTDWGDGGYAWMNHYDFLRQAGRCYGIIRNRRDLAKMTGTGAPAAAAEGEPPASAPHAAAAR